MKNLIFVNGTMGVGKTTVCRALNRLLPNSVLLDGDWCWYMDPFVVTEETKTLVMDNICHLLHGFLDCTVFENVIFCWVMHQPEITENILERLDLSGCRLFRFSLMCSEETLRARLYGDVQAGRRTADVIARSVARLPLYHRQATVQIYTDISTPEQCAEQIRGAILSDSGRDGASSYR